MVKVNFVSRIKQHIEDYLSEFVYGGIDGAVTTFAVVAGATGANFSTKIILVLGFANLIADGFSMGVGSYLSSKSTLELKSKRKESIKNEPSPIINGLTTYISFILIGFTPLMAYTVDYILGQESQNVFIVAVLLTLLAFVGIGLLKSKVAHSHIPRAITETVLLGAIAASLAYLLGAFLENIIT